ncbi:hypothetical protein BDZ91DRAFT_549742 [Kalaharituber pfeilii]|nr:hypothetical protein BDZ91DRAFT_549742 [Kalaharituber pfeilii]
MPLPSASLPSFQHARPSRTGSLARLLMLMTAAVQLHPCASASLPPLMSVHDGHASTVGRRADAGLSNDYFEALGNNTLFDKWRPRYHFMAPAGWMNVCIHF